MSGYELADTPRRPADARITVQQIGSAALMEVGAREFLRDDERGELRFTIGMGARTGKAIVVLCADDTYTVEIGRLRRPRGELVPEWTTLAVRRGIYAEQLAEQLVDMWCTVNS